MQVRKFEATTMRDAISAVKKELGPNAVILSTKELPATEDGIPKLYEVTAAAGVSNKAGAESKNPAKGPPALNSADPEIMTKLSALSESVASSKQLRMVEGSINDVKNLVLEILRESKPNSKIPAHLFPINRILNAAGVDATVNVDLIRHLSSLPSPNDIASVSSASSEAYYREHAMRWLMKRIKIAPKWVGASGMTNVHMILGTPGSGKSTLVSKIATAVSKKDRHKVAILSWDPEKLGASEQTRIYSKILGVEHYVIARAVELKPTIMKLRDVDLLLVDTAGRNPVDTSSLVDLEVIKSQGLALEFHLALSATEKTQLQDRTIRHFSAVGISSVAYTKLDEIPAWGDVFNATSKWSVPVSWLSWSANPSDSPERASRENIVEQIFKAEF